ncbi:LOW QUALITY PROTEIN: hypothetical protein SETIT_5G419500v2 [Setaria italica]|uniref:Uncharacterized protein n=1 Tax=Setaria italica TaxID=4555 RepID=A0A368RER6_SETIT|nr:LOW QUALITY PROTEIN: hypothetical protein SETIT_5G419500v2 [Setaria italica]
MPRWVHSPTPSGLVPHPGILLAHPGGAPPPLRRPHPPGAPNARGSDGPLPDPDPSKPLTLPYPGRHALPRSDSISSPSADDEQAGHYGSEQAPSPPHDARRRSEPEQQKLAPTNGSMLQ